MEDKLDEFKESSSGPKKEGTRGNRVEGRNRTERTPAVYQVELKVPWMHYPPE
jgi:hypothetical protein